SAASSFTLTGTPSQFHTGQIFLAAQSSVVLSPGIAGIVVGDKPVSAMTTVRLAAAADGLDFVPPRIVYASGGATFCLIQQGTAGTNPPSLRVATSFQVAADAGFPDAVQTWFYVDAETSFEIDTRADVANNRLLFVHSASTVELDQTASPTFHRALPVSAKSVVRLDGSASPSFLRAYGVSASSRVLVRQDVGLRTNTMLYAAGRTNVVLSGLPSLNMVVGVSAGTSFVVGGEATSGRDIYVSATSG